MRYMKIKGKIEKEDSMMDRHITNGLCNGKNNPIRTLQDRKRTMYLYDNVNKEKIIGFNQMEI